MTKPALSQSGFQSASRTHKGLVRPHNEDAILVREGAGLWAVADGMGGHQAGDYASRTVVEALERAGAGAAGVLADVVARIDDANRTIFSAASGRTVGATVVVLIINGGSFNCVWAGDSRLYRLRDKILSRITRDHSLVQGLIDRGALTEDEARTHPRANVITRAVGIAPDIELEASHGDVRPGDVFLLCSDGLTGLLEDKFIEEHLAEPDLEAVAESLLQASLDAGAPDNVSLVIVRIIA